MKEHKLEIILTPHSHDNPEKPFFWAILQHSQGTWVNTGLCGWEKTPLEAFMAATAAVENIKEE